jgi:hypothetical protein
MDSQQPLTLEYVESLIASVDYVAFDDDKLIACVLTLKNGFEVVGTSDYDPIKDFNDESVKRLAWEKSVVKVFQFERYVLKQKLFESSKS